MNTKFSALIRNADIFLFSCSQKHKLEDFFFLANNQRKHSPHGIFFFLTNCWRRWIWNADLHHYSFTFELDFSSSIHFISRVSLLSWFPWYGTTIVTEIKKKQLQFISVCQISFVTHGKFSVNKTNWFGCCINNHVFLFYLLFLSLFSCPLHKFMILLFVFVECNFHCRK